MKKRIIMCFAAAVLAFAACTKDDEKKTDNNVTTSAGQNELVIDGARYQMDSHVMVDYNNGNRHYVDANLHGNDTLRLLRADAEGEYLHSSFDLSIFSNPGEYSFDITMGDVFIWQDNHSDAGVYGALSGVDYDSEAVFSNGTLVIEETTEGFSYKIDGTTKDNHTVSLWLYVAHDDYEPCPWKK